LLILSLFLLPLPPEPHPSYFFSPCLEHPHEEEPPVNVTITIYLSPRDENDPPSLEAACGDITIVEVIVSQPYIASFFALTTSYPFSVYQRAHQSGEGFGDNINHTGGSVATRHDG
jgi:hypothetical protein